MYNYHDINWLVGVYVTQPILGFNSHPFVYYKNGGGVISPSL